VTTDLTRRADDPAAVLRPGPVRAEDFGGHHRSVRPLLQIQLWMELYMKIYGCIGGRIALIDQTDEEDVIDGLLQAMWEAPASLSGGFCVFDDAYSLTACITVTEVLQEHDGIVEVYEVGREVRRLRVTYLLSDDVYVGTDIIEISPSHGEQGASMPVTPSAGAVG
jgi:hypothetical protein